MKKIIFMFLFICVFYSCTDSTKENPSHNLTDSARLTPVTNQHSQSPVILSDTISPHPISSDKIPDGISYKGELESAYSWYDKNGKNILVLSIASSSVYVKVIESDENTRELMAKLFIIKPQQKPELLWNLYDIQKKCVFDITADFIGAPDICDTDHNNINEVYMLYKLSCRSDASPSDMKLIVHEGKQKFALRGTMIFRYNDFPDSLFSNNRELDLSKVPKEELEKGFAREWGCFQNTNDFKNAKPVILQHAIDLWRDNSWEN